MAKYMIIVLLIFISGFMIDSITIEKEKIVLEKNCDSLLIQQCNFTALTSIERRQINISEKQVLESQLRANKDRKELVFFLSVLSVLTSVILAFYIILRKIK